MAAHVHAEMIKAWADGAKIERMVANTLTRDMKWIPCPFPTWREWETYRVAPANTTDVFVSVVANGDSIAASGAGNPNLCLTFDEDCRLISARVL